MTEPASDDGPLTFINVFEIPEDEIDAFIVNWESRSRLMTTADGFVSAELHRAITPDTEFKLINVSRWESMEHFRAATTDPQYRSELDRYQSADESTWTPHRGFYRTALKLD